MVEMLPFCGVRYSSAYTRPQVYAPPYDVISSEMLATLTARDAFNISHIDVTPANAGEDWYARASGQFNAWLQKGILVRDQQPAYYGYEQHFTLNRNTSFFRRGLFALVRLAPWGEGIFRHEQTRAAPRTDRLNLMRATRAQLSPVFGMVDDSQLRLHGWLRSPAEPAVDYTDEEGTRQIFWPLNEPEEVAEIKSFLADKDIVIADGHHRYETALAYRDERRSIAGASSETQPYDYVLMYVTALQDPGLCILPTHRVIAGSEMPDLSALMKLLSVHFEVTAIQGERSLEALIRPFADTGTVFGLYLGKDIRWLCRLKESNQSLASSGVPVLDVSILQNLVLEPCFGIDASTLKAGDRVFYTISEAEACARVDQGLALAACILNPTRLSQVWQTARQQQTMPQKSTYFYPKLLTGLVMHTL